MKLLLNNKAKDAFENYLLDATLPVFRVFAVFTSAFNLFLVVPDIMNMDSQTIWLSVSMRVFYSAALLSSLLWIDKLKNYIARSVLITFYELFAVFIFIFVFWLYPQPDFLIQLLGVMAIIIMTFVVPNKFAFGMSVAVVSAVSYLLLARYKIPSLQDNQFFVGLVYLFFEISVGGVFSILFRRYQFREFVAKTELERIYSTDPLTKIGNRVKLEEEAVKWLSCCEKDNLPLSIVLMDVDNLKLINDSHGHIVGDTVLYETAQILRANLRDNDVCVRWGGDEFVLLLPYIGAAQAQQLAMRIRDAVTSYEFSARIDVSCSFGITQMQRGQSLEELIAQADKTRKCTPTQR